MLFDLRGRGRRRTVQVIYLGLAVLFLLGFVGFGVGVGGSGGGLINALTNNKGSGGANYSSQVSAAQKRTKRDPSNPAGWAALTEAQLHQASEGAYYEQSTGKFTGKGKELLTKVAHSWSTYLALEPHNPNSELAQRMVTVYGEEGLNQPAAVVQALQIVIADKPPSAALYGALAEYSYKAKNTRQGDLASEKAVNLAPPGERKHVKAELEAVKQNPTGGSSGSSVPNTTYTTTQGGKTYTVKPGKNGTLTGATTPATTSSRQSSTVKK
jgi:hypothetical protein